MGIVEKLIRVQSELKAPKSQFNSFGKYNYRNCEDILEAAKPLCHKNGLLLYVSDEIVEIGGRVYVKASASVTDGTDTISVTGYAREAAEKKGMDESQVTGSTSSYARKYALGGLFSLDDTKDADTDSYTQQTKTVNYGSSKTAKTVKQTVPVQWQHRKCEICGKEVEPGVAEQVFKVTGHIFCSKECIEKYNDLTKANYEERAKLNGN